MKVTLLPNLVQFPSHSMHKYAAELAGALRTEAPAGWQIESLRCEHMTSVAALLPGTFGAKLAERLGRLVKYPLLAAATRSDVFHVLDHSHAHLIPSLDPKRTVITCHDIIPLLANLGKIDMPPDPISKHTFGTKLKLMQRCAQIIAISESTKKGLIEEVGIPEEQISVVYNGLTPCFTPAANSTEKQKDRQAIRDLFGLSPETKIILQVATKSRYKNTLLILKALSQLSDIAKANPPIRLLRVGFGFFDDEAEFASTHNLAPLIVQAGQVKTDEELAKIYRAADVLLFPSVWEGFGWPPLEAMACGLPVIASNVASLPEVIAEAGILINPKDLQALIQGTVSILNDSALSQSLSEKGIEQARSFTWKNTAIKTLAVYEQVARFQK